MKTKIHYKTEIKRVDLNPGLAEIEIFWELPSKEVIERNKPEFIDVIPTIHCVYFYLFNYGEDLNVVEIQYKHFFLVQKEIENILSDFKRISYKEYLEIINAVEDYFDSQTVNETKPAIPENHIIQKPALNKVSRFAQNLERAYQLKKDKMSEEDRNLMEKGFSVIKELLSKI